MKIADRFASFTPQIQSILRIVTAVLFLQHGTAKIFKFPHQPMFDSLEVVSLIGLAGILMRNTLILTEQIKENQAAGLDDYQAVVEATVQRTRPVILTALAAVLAFIPLTESVFWGSMAFTLIGGTAVGTVLILLFLPALYAAWFRIKPTVEAVPQSTASIGVPDLRMLDAAE